MKNDMSMAADIHFYLPVNDDAMRWGIYTTGIGRSTIPSGSSYPPPHHPRLYDFRWTQGRVLPEFAVVFINEGKGIFESEASGRVKIGDSSAIFLFPGEWHRYQPMQETGWTERWFCFNGELAHRLMAAPLLQRERPVRRIADPAAIIEAFDAILEKILLNPAGNSVLLSLHVLGLLGQIIEAASGVELPSAIEPSHRRDLIADAVVSKAVAMIWTRGHQPISVEQIAEASGVTRRTLERRFQQAIGRSIVEEIIECRMNRAKRLLEETEMPVKIVAYLSGFPCAERMRVAFCQREGVSPVEFRRTSRHG
jgi:AraC-like DNA-binding protein